MDTSLAKPSGDEAFKLDAESIGQPFHRFQALKATDLPAALASLAEFSAAMARRIRWEEAEVFPECLQRTGGGLESICDTLREEHREIAILLDGIAAKLSQANTSTEAEETALQALLAGHNDREHSVVFPALE